MPPGDDHASLLNHGAGAGFEYDLTSVRIHRENGDVIVAKGLANEADRISKERVQVQDGGHAPADLCNHPELGAGLTFESLLRGHMQPERHLVREKTQRLAFTVAEGSRSLTLYRDCSVQVAVGDHGGIHDAADSVAQLKRGRWSKPRGI